MGMEYCAAKFLARSRFRAAMATTSAPKVSLAGVMMPRGAIRAAPRMPIRIMARVSHDSARCGIVSRHTIHASLCGRSIFRETFVTRAAPRVAPRVALIGDTGRMGTAIVRAVVAEQSLAAEQLALTIVAAVASAGSKSAGRDVGEVAGTSTLGVRVLEEVPPDLAQAQVVIDFSRPDLSLRVLNVCRAAR